MKVTTDFLEALLVRGWSIRGVNGCIEFRDPHGVSGQDFKVENLGEFPPAVEHWILENIPRVPAQ